MLKAEDGIFVVVREGFGAVESVVGEMREDVSAIKATIPHLATKADIGQVRVEPGAVTVELRQAEDSSKECGGRDYCSSFNGARSGS